MTLIEGYANSLKDTDERRALDDLIMISMLVGVLSVIDKCFMDMVKKGKDPKKFTPSMVSYYKNQINKLIPTFIKIGTNKLVVVYHSPFSGDVVSNYVVESGTIFYPPMIDLP